MSMKKKALSPHAVVVSNMDPNAAINKEIDILVREKVTLLPYHHYYIKKGGELLGQLVRTRRQVFSVEQV